MLLHIGGLYESEEGGSFRPNFLGESIRLRVISVKVYGNLLVSNTSKINNGLEYMRVRGHVHDVCM